MKRFCILMFFCVLCMAHLQAQPTTNVRHKMAIFTPLYLDEAFDFAGSYKYSGKSFPKQAINGLEFYHGAMMAIDTLNQMNLSLDVYVYDSKSARETLEQQFSKCAADGVELIIANCSLSELGKLAKLGADKKITVLNATVPNDANVTENPYFVVINPTIQTQIENLYSYIKTNYKGTPVVVVTQKESSSDRYIRTVLETLNKHYKDSVKLSFREMGNDLALKALSTTTQPTQVGLFIVGSLDTELGNNVLKQLAENSKNYATLTVIGMPTWENLNFSKPEYNGVNIIYSTPFYNSKTDAVSRAITNYYNKKMYARPSDLVFRAYSLTYRFGNMLNRYGKDINKKLGGSEYKTFYDLDIQPSYLNGKISHYENKKLYFLKYFNGSIISIN